MKIGQTGIRLKCNCGSDLTGATNIKMNYEKPDGTTGTWDAELDDTAKMIQYTTVEGDIDQAGRWKFEPSFNLDGFSGAAESRGSQIVYATLV